ncbi:MAG: hypothetical protein A2086_10645 [Spirochaetes bacterium GWD1_27_9]|nr:MAG: hypothetical protein A2Z98_09085 [Spirochaetes bacterium GWB1_27_13]OHD26907.1 MAG: hypothetical protein A2Y34_09260 [Spirochaetes bacterium GWC1_27_15]OHD34879.1 MAG: hypothetical protein A2086_10645 [Spirochaetes bacterium GWD1_27_9]
MFKFLKYFIGVLFVPKKTLINLIEDSKKIKYSIFLMFFIMCLFSINMTLLVIFKVNATIPILFLKVTPENYHFWILVLSNPLHFFLFIMTAGTIQFFIKIFDGKGTYDDTLVMSIYILSASFAFYWLFELIIAIYLIQTPNVPSIVPVIIEISMGIILVWQIFLLPLGIKIVHKLNRLQSFIIALLSLIPYWVFLVVFYG